jgi:cytochrome c biogenesis protein CcdA
MAKILEILSLAVVDAINPCALAVMTIVLTSLLLSNPKNRKKVLTGGLAFTSAVFILYFLYGLGMTSIFDSIAKYAVYVNKIIAIFAIGLGILNIKDFLMYKPGGLATEMPLFMRPKMKIWIKKMTSPKGAFIIGLIVTFFLLPCTIGPYIVASQRLSNLSLFTRIIWLLFYNIIFILPMLGITFAIYFGLTSVEKVSSWKEKNIQKLHLIEGIILTTLGILIITGILH